MSTRGVTGAIPFSARRRTAVIFTGEGTSVAYLAGVAKALVSAGVKIDLVLGKGAGALVAAFLSAHGEKRLYEGEGLLDELKTRRPWRTRPVFLFVAACLASSFLAFLAPTLLVLVSIVTFPLITLFGDGAAAGEAATEGFLGANNLYRLLAAAEPFYLRAVALPLVLCFTYFAARGLVTIVRGRGIRFSWQPLIAPRFFDLAPLASLVEASLWQTVRGASAEERPKSSKSLGDSYQKLMKAGLGQHGFRELVFYALDTDTGQEVPFVFLKERYLKKLRSRFARPSRAEPIDLAEEGAPLFFDALLSALSPPALTDEIPLKLPLGGKYGGEVHRFSSSLLAGQSILEDAIAAGAEQVVYVCGAPAFDPSSGSAWERLSDAALRHGLDRDLSLERASAEMPVHVIRPEKQRLDLFELRGRAQLGNERLGLSALSAHGERDAERLFVQPILGENVPAADESTVPIAHGDWEAGPREL